jgi:hypothetical protein
MLGTTQRHVLEVQIATIVEPIASHRRTLLYSVLHMYDKGLHLHERTQQ